MEKEGRSAVLTPAIRSNGKTPYERRFGEPFGVPIILLGSMVEYHLTRAKDQARLHKYGTKVLSLIFFGHALVAEKIWKWARERGSNAREWDGFVSPFTDGLVKWQEYFSRKSANHNNVRGEPWSISGSRTNRHRVGQRVKLYVPTERSLPTPLKKMSDAVSAHTQFKMEDAPTLLKLHKYECPDMWIRLPRQKWPRSWSTVEGPVVLFERKHYGHSFTGLLWTRHINGSSVLRVGKSTILGTPVCATSKWLGTSTMLNLCGTDWWSVLIWRNATTFLDQVYLGCTRRECKQNSGLVDGYRKVFDTTIRSSRWKVAWFWEIERACHRVDLRHSRACK